jgi:TFIIF-interacting CTD phosphatase-like protein
LEPGFEGKVAGRILIQMGINVRPGCAEFLRHAAEKFELIAFTASDEWYAKAIVGYIDPKMSFFTAIVSRKHCLKRTMKNL